MALKIVVGGAWQRIMDGASEHRCNDIKPMLLHVFANDAEELAFTNASMYDRRNRINCVFKHRCDDIESLAYATIIQVDVRLRAVHNSGRNEPREASTRRKCCIAHSRNMDTTSHARGRRHRKFHTWLDWGMTTRTTSTQKQFVQNPQCLCGR